MNGRGLGFAFMNGRGFGARNWILEQYLMKLAVSNARFKQGAYRLRKSKQLQLLKEDVMIGLIKRSLKIQTDSIQSFEHTLHKSGKASNCKMLLSNPA
ncbi:hypothetical protein Trydic_g9107 [Trypoxylus dichotomus]